MIIARERVIWREAVPLDQVDWYEPELAPTENDGPTEQLPQLAQTMGDPAREAGPHTPLLVLRRIRAREHGGLVLSIVAVALVGLLCGLSAWSIDRSSGSRVPVLATILIGLVLGWIAIDVRQAYRRGRLYR